MATRAEEAPVRWGLGDVALGLLAVVVVPSVVLGTVLGAMGREDADGLALWQVALFQVPLWVGLGGVPWWASRSKGRGDLRRDFGLEARRSDVVTGLLAGLAGQLVLGLLLLPIYEALGIDDTGEAARDLADRAEDPFGVACLVLVAVAGAAVFEELFYRGLVLRALQKRFGPGVAVVGSSVLFGLMHFQAADTIALTGVGLLLALLTVRSGRLGPAIWAHVAFNLTAVVSLLAT